MQELNAYNQAEKDLTNLLKIIWIAQKHKTKLLLER